MPLTLAEVATGVERKVIAKLLEPCDRCEGSGAEPGSSSQTCPTCAGQGEVRRAQKSFFGQFVTVGPCPTCHGDGRVVQTPCKKCRGEGRLRGEREINVHVPAGVATGQYMTLRGVGNAGTRGGPRGDVHIVFEVADDSRFERDGEDLYTEVLVTFAQLALGAEVSVPTVSGHTTLNVPAGTQSGTLFHLRGRGLPRVNASGTGDLHVRVQLWTPDLLTDEERKLIERLAELQPGVPADSRGKGFWAKMKEALGA
jgi:molecular chaperone DnaJ